MKIIWGVAAFLTVSSALAGTAPENYIKQASLLKPAHAAAVLAADTLGEQLPAGLTLEVAKFLRDNTDKANSQGAANLEAFSGEFARALVGSALAGPRVPYPGQQVTADLPALPTLLPDPTQPLLPQLWNRYGLGVTLAWVVAAYAAPDLAPWMLPGSARQIGTYARTKVHPTTTTGTVFVPGITPGISVGASYTISALTEIDAFTVTAIDSNLLTDAIAVHLPVATRVDITVTCIRTTVVMGSSRCATNSLSNPSTTTTTATTAQDRVLATHPTITFGYPLNAGVFATRATGSDALQVAYDALGTVWTQAPREKWLSPFLGVPGLEALVPGTGVADLAPQAPPVSFIGLQTAMPDSVAARSLNQALALLGLGSLPLREAAPVAAPLGLGGNWSLGATAGYRAAELRSGKTNLIFVRWHNLGTTTLGTFFDNLVALLHVPLPSLAAKLPSAKATIYYDVPPGEYALGEERVDAQGAVYKVDWTVARDAPTLVLPPALPEVGNLVPAVRNAACALTGLCPP